MIRSIAASLILGVSVLGFAACGGTVIADDGPCDPEEQCPEGLYPMESCGDGSNCTAVTACGETILCGPAPCFDGCCEGDDSGECCNDSIPACNDGDLEVSTCPPNASCYELDFCERRIVCQSGGCLGDPSCDPGDFNAGTTCPPDAICYELPTCGGLAIQCIDTVQPVHGCPISPPDNFELCDTKDMFCNYPTSPECFDTYVCQEGAEVYTWEWAGGGCEGN